MSWLRGWHCDNNGEKMERGKCLWRERCWNDLQKKPYHEQYCQPTHLTKLNYKIKF